MEKIKLALDWTPNINHIGFFVAQSKGFYQDRGIEVEITSPQDDNYAVTPAKKVELGQADLALCPMESVLSYRTKANPFGMKAIAAIFQVDLSAIATLGTSGISNPKELDGKTYASYKARYEDEIVKQMIKNDGGNGDIEILYPEKLGIWDTILSNKTDSTWIFTNWEGVQADGEGIKLNLFRMKNCQIPYSYSPVIVMDENVLSEREETFRKFIEATKEGFLFSKGNREESCAILAPLVSKSDQNIDLIEALDRSAGALGDQSTWGIMQKGEVQAYLDWIYNHHLESQQVSTGDLITNELLASNS